MNTLWGLVLILTVIVIHEAGHAIAARACGVGLLKFSIGFGPGIVLFRTKNFPIMLSLLPFGGYVSIKTKRPADELKKIRSKIKATAPDSKKRKALETLIEGFEKAAQAQRNAPGAYLEDVSYWRKMVIFAAGIIANLVSATIALALIYIFAPGTEVSILGHNLLIGSPGGGWSGALVNALLDTSTTFWKIIKNIYKVIPKTFRDAYEIIVNRNLTPHRGTIGIVQEGAKAAHNGFANTFFLFYFISLVVAALNLLPLGILDGGHLFLQTIKRIIGDGKATKIVEIVLLFFGIVFISLLLLNSVSSDLYDIYNYFK